MTIARKSVFAGVVVSLGALAACQSAGPGGPGMACKRRRRQLDERRRRRRLELLRRRLHDAATDTGQKLAEGSYIVAGNTVQINGTSVIRQSPISFNCLLVSPKQLNCTSSAGQNFSLSAGPDAPHRDGGIA